MVRLLPGGTSPEEAGADIALLALCAVASAQTRAPIERVIVQPDGAPLQRAAVVKMLAAMPRVRRCSVQGRGDTLLLTVEGETDALELDLARQGTDSVRTLVREFGGEDFRSPVLVDAGGELLRATWAGLEAWLTGYSGDGAFSYSADDPDEAMAATGVRAVVWIGLPPAQYEYFASWREPT